MRIDRVRAILLLNAAMLVPGAIPGQAQRRNDRDPQRDARYYDGMQQGYRGGYNDQYDHRYYDTRDQYNRSQGGIGPGKGALIGGAGGAALGAIFGGGLKGALIGGGAGAGVGAIAGKVHQNNRRGGDWRDDRRGR